MHNIDHLVYATPDLETGILEIEKLLNVRARPGGRHPAMGTANALISLADDTYLEIIAPDPDRSTPEKPPLFGIDKLDKSRLVTWVIRSSGLETLVKNAEAHGVSVGKIFSGNRVRPDGVTLTWRFTDPTLFLEGGIVPFVIDWAETPHPSSDSPKGGTLINLRAEHPEPQRAREILNILELELPVSIGKTPLLIATIETPNGMRELH